MTTLEVGLIGLFSCSILVILILLVLRSKLLGTIRQKESRANELEQMLLEARRRASQLAKATGQWDEEVKSREERISELALRLQETHGHLQEAKRSLEQVEADKEESARLFEKQVDRAQNLAGELARTQAELAEVRKECETLKSESSRLRDVEAQLTGDAPPAYAQRVQEAEERVLQLTRQLGDQKEIERNLRADLEASERRLAELADRPGEPDAAARAPEKEASTQEPVPETPMETLDAEDYTAPVFGWAGPLDEEEPVAAPEEEARTQDESAGDETPDPAGELPEDLEADAPTEELEAGEPAEGETAAQQPPEEAPDADMVETRMVEEQGPEPNETVQAILEDRDLSAVQKRIVLDMYVKFVGDRVEGVQFQAGGEADARRSLEADPRIDTQQLETLLQIYDRFTKRRRS